MQKIITRLKKIPMDGKNAQLRDELRQRFNENIYHVINCANCNRKWKIKRNCKPVTPIRLRAMPPDEFPAGSCPACGGTYCIGCAKKRIDQNGRFICQKCRVNLKLTEEGLKKIVYDWAVKAIPGNRKAGRA
jgi:hypothetical protein